MDEMTIYSHIWIKFLGFYYSVKYFESIIFRFALHVDVTPETAPQTFIFVEVCCFGKNFSAYRATLSRVVAVWTTRHVQFIEVINKKCEEFNYLQNIKNQA